MKNNQRASYISLTNHAKSSFDKWALTYDSGFSNIFFSLNSDEIIKQIDFTKSRLKILDVGCGTGNLLLKIARKYNKSIELVGVDLSPKMISIAKEKLEENSFINYETGTSDNLKFNSNYFDYVICSNSLHHHPSTQNSLKEMTRVLKKNGKLIIVDGILDGIFRKINFYIINKIQNEGTVYRFTKSEIKKLLAEFGYKKIYQKEILYVNLLTSGLKE